MDKSGQLFTLPESFKDVDEYKEKEIDGICTIKIRSGIINYFLNDIPSFYKYVEGPRDKLSSYKKIDTPEYISFKCTRNSN